MMISWYDFWIGVQKYMSHDAWSRRISNVLSLTMGSLSFSQDADHMFCEERCSSSALSVWQILWWPGNLLSRCLRQDVARTLWKNLPNLRKGKGWIQLTNLTLWTSNIEYEKKTKQTDQLLDPCRWVLTGKTSWHCQIKIKMNQIKSVNKLNALNDTSTHYEKQMWYTKYTIISHKS